MVKLPGGNFILSIFSTAVKINIDTQPRAAPCEMIDQRVTCFSCGTGLGSSSHAADLSIKDKRS